MFPLDAEALEAAEAAVSRTCQEHARNDDDPAAFDRDAAEAAVTAYLIVYWSRRALEELTREDPRTARRAA